MRTLLCPLCGSRWKVTNGNGASETLYVTCVPCEEKAPQQVHEADWMELEDMEGPDEHE